MICDYDWIEITEELGARSPGWYRATCQRCETSTTGYESVVADWTHQHSRECPKTGVAELYVDSRCSRHECRHKQGYVMTGGCYNCRTENIQGIFTQGHEAGNRKDDCPACGCRTIHWDELGRNVNEAEQ